jgi:hypothetical protein
LAELGADQCGTEAVVRPAAELKRGLLPADRDIEGVTVAEDARVTQAAEAKSSNRTHTMDGHRSRTASCEALRHGRRSTWA